MVGEVGGQTKFDLHQVVFKEIRRIAIHCEDGREFHSTGPIRDQCHGHQIF